MTRGSPGDRAFQAGRVSLDPRVPAGCSAPRVNVVETVKTDNQVRRVSLVCQGRRGVLVDLDYLVFLGPLDYEDWTALRDSMVYLEDQDLMARTVCPELTESLEMLVERVYQDSMVCRVTQGYQEVLGRRVHRADLGRRDYRALTVDQV